MDFFFVHSTNKTSNIVVNSVQQSFIQHKTARENIAKCNQNEAKKNIKLTTFNFYFHDFYRHFSTEYIASVELWAILCDFVTFLLTDSRTIKYSSHDMQQNTIFI